MDSRSFSSSCSLASYLARIFSWCSFRALRKAGVSVTPSPPVSIWPCKALMRPSSRFFSSFSRRNSRLRASKARMAAILSSSARRRCSSSSSNLRLSTTLRDRSSSSVRRRRSSRSYRRSSDFWSRSSFTRASFLMFFALLANLSVESDSTNASSAGLIIAIIVVLQLPPRLSSRMRVSLESLYGMCCLPRGSVRAAMTLPRDESDWLIFRLSSSRCPVAPVSRTLSDPAKSTRFSLPTLNIWRTLASRRLRPSSPCALDLTSRWNCSTESSCPSSSR
mmetsp:Transcript_1429/g.5628  ORF Transcript_1429/g.5628 Transcript_1429/m.5628 type:complete len:278 (-) Transcript_1429:895-1728(-)